jgi:hypothetical protein
MGSGTLGAGGTGDVATTGASSSGDPSASSPLLAPPTPDSSGGGSGALLDIVVHQRDRFRQRVAQLEDEKSESCLEKECPCLEASLPCTQQHTVGCAWKAII